jgi:hypothetical protein
VTDRPKRAGQRRRSADLPGQQRLFIVGAARAKKVARAVVAQLAPKGREGASRKELARLTGYPLRTIQRAVANLVESREIVETPLGICLASTYHDLTADTTALLGFQKLHFEVTNWRETPTPPVRTARTWRVVSGGDAPQFETTELGWRGRSVVLQYYPSTGTLVGRVGARNPIPLELAGELYGWLAAMLGLDRGEHTRVLLIEVLSDHPLVHLEENYLELRDLPAVCRVIYQKADRLRNEIRLNRPSEDGEELPLTRALELLVEGSPLARAERLTRLELELVAKQAVVLKLQAETRRKAEELARGAPEGAAPERRDPSRVTPSDSLGSGFA